MEGGGGESQVMLTGCHNAHLESLPREPALEQEKQRVGQRLEVVAAACCAAQVGMYTGVPHRTAEVIRSLIVPHMHPSFLPSCCCGRRNQCKIISRVAAW